MPRATEGKARLVHGKGLPMALHGCERTPAAQTPPRALQSAIERALTLPGTRAASAAVVCETAPGVGPGPIWHILRGRAWVPRRIWWHYPNVRQDL
eukprot:10831474-Alexandrium_andersonii.AAC.2